GFFETRIQRAETALDRDDEERHGDERFRHHGGSGRERDLQPEGLVERFTDQAAPAEGQQQSHAADDRRQHHGQRRQRAQKAARDTRRPAQDEGERYAHDQGRGRCEKRADQRKRQRSRRRGRDQRRAELAPWRTDYKPQKREQEQKQAGPGEDTERQRNPGPAHTPSKPAVFRIACPSPRRTK